jgi:hypothetical protein
VGGAPVGFVRRKGVRAQELRATAAGEGGGGTARGALPGARAEALHAERAREARRAALPRGLPRRVAARREAVKVALCGGPVRPPAEERARRREARAVLCCEVQRGRGRQLPRSTLRVGRARGGQRGLARLRRRNELRPDEAQTRTREPGSPRDASARLQRGQRRQPGGGRHAAIARGAAARGLPAPAPLEASRIGRALLEPRGEGTPRPRLLFCRAAHLSARPSPRGRGEGHGTGGAGVGVGVEGGEERKERVAAATAARRARRRRQREHGAVAGERQRRSGETGRSEKLAQLQGWRAQ